MMPLVLAIAKVEDEALGLASTMPLVLSTEW
jgi:hypothetical protein